MKLSIFILLIPLSSCALIDSSKIAPGYSEAYQAFNNLIFGYDEESISYDIIKEIPYASALVKIGKGPVGLLILQEKNKESLTWVSADGVYLRTMKGRIVRTAGLDNNLIYSSYPDIRMSLSSNASLPLLKYYYTYDFPSLNNLELKAQINYLKTEEINLISGKKELMLFEEKIHSDILGWEVSNLYWVDSNNFIWKSIQYISPLLPEIQIEITKKPS